VSARALRVLVLEDRAEDAELVLHALQRAGLEVDWTRVDDETGYRTHLVSELDLILADYNLPQFDALHALDILKQAALDIPFIIVSGTVGEEVAVSAMRAGATDYVFKGNLSRLAAAVEREVQACAERKATEAATKKAEESVLRLAAIVESSDDAIFAADLRGTIISWNPAAERLYGYAREEAIGQNAGVLLSPGQPPASDPGYADRLREGQRIDPFETVRVRKDGTQVDVSVSLSAVKDGLGRVTAISVIARDISERKHAQRALEYQALHDALTGLPNRTLLRDRLQQAILHARRANTPIGLLLLDLDNFREVNDTFGHQAGDSLLQQLGPRLRNHLRESDTVARLGGDEIGVVVPGADAVGALEVADQLRKAIELPFTIEDQPLQVSGSIGIAVFPQHGEDADSLLRRADIAMYVAKRSGADAVVYDSQDDRHSADRLMLLSELRQAVERHELLLHYQPQVLLRSGRVTGLEALVRWQHPRRGLVPPSEFIPLSERSGIIKPLSYWVLATALHQCRAWRQAGWNVNVSVNLSMRNLLDPELPAAVTRLLAASEAEPHSLTVEITESVLMADPKRAMENLARLRELGLQFSIDDFGTGYSSLAYLQRLAVNEVKIDRSFVMGLPGNDGSRAIVKATVELGHSLGFEVVAEGVENRDAWDMLAALGCDKAQGYFISRPIPAPQAGEWLKTSSLTFEAPELAA
jgi:diguanylate cyclase (GGDEF)-like protein/PAS domain S-box-containing protein